jgi:hypothetical protein
MRLVLSSRRGVASVIGTILFVIVLLVALGTLEYADALQGQSAQSQQAALNLMAARASTSLTFQYAANSLSVANGGSSGVTIVDVILRFANGSVYPISANTPIPSGGSQGLSTLVTGTCGGSSCTGKYNTLLANSNPGDMVGVLTSTGACFWSDPASDSAPATGSAQAVAATANVVTSGTKKWSSTTLVVTLSPSTNYVFYVFTAIEPSFGTEQYNFEVHALPAGGTLVNACATLGEPTDVGSFASCVSSTGKPVANGFSFGAYPPIYETPGIFGTVDMGSTGGPLQIDFACTANCGSVTLLAGSFMVVQAIS